MSLPCTHIISSSTGISHPIEANLTCDSLDIIYIIKCTKCNKQRVGECQSAKQRLPTYIKACSRVLPTELQSSCAIVSHFEDTHHSPGDLEITIVDQVPPIRHIHPAVRNAIRMRLEWRWIHLLDAKLNTKVNWWSSFPGGSQPRDRQHAD